MGVPPPPCGLHYHLCVGNVHLRVASSLPTFCGSFCYCALGADLGRFVGLINPVRGFPGTPSGLVSQLAVVPIIDETCSASCKHFFFFFLSLANGSRFSDSLSVNTNSTSSLATFTSLVSTYPSSGFFSVAINARFPWDFGIISDFGLEKLSRLDIVVL